MATADPFTPMAENTEHLGRELAALNFCITALDALVMEADEDEWAIDLLAHALKEGREYFGYLKDVLSSLERLVGDRMTEYQQTIEGVGTLERHRNKSLTQWDKDDLLQAVLDTRMVDVKSGEVIEETPLDKVLAVWNLPAPRTTVLKTRGLEPDEFCTVTDNGGYKVVIR